MNEFLMNTKDIKPLIEQIQKRTTNVPNAFKSAGFTEEEFNNIASALWSSPGIFSINLNKLLNLLSQNEITPRMVSKDFESKIPVKDPNETLFRMLAAKIIAKRQQLGMSTGKLSELSNVSRSAIINIESGTKKWQMDTLIAVCNVLEIDISDLIMNENDYNRMNSIGESLQSQQFNKLKSDLQEIYQREELSDATNNYLSATTPGKKSQINKELRLMMQKQSKTNETVSDIGAAAVATAMVIASINAPATGAVFGTLALMSLFKNKTN